MKKELKSVVSEEVVTAINREVTNGVLNTNCKVENGVLNRNCIKKEDLDLDLCEIFFDRKFEEIEFDGDLRFLHFCELNPDVFNVSVYTTGVSVSPHIAFGDLIWDRDFKECRKGFLLSYVADFEPKSRELDPDMTLKEVIDIVKKTLRGIQLDKIQDFSDKIKDAIKEDEYEIEVDEDMYVIIDAFNKDMLDMSVWDYFDEVVKGENYLTDIELVEDIKGNTFFKFNINKDVNE